MPKILKHKICPVSGEKFSIYDKELEILEKASPKIDGKIINIPEPIYSPKTRDRIRMIFRNERHLYKRTCSATGDNIISVFPEEYKGPVFHFKYFESDKWNPEKYSQLKTTGDYLKDFKTLFKQYPKTSLNLSANMQDCDYCNYGMNSKSCYMCQISFESENCLYTYVSYKSKYDVDGYINDSCEKTYEGIHLGHCFNVYHSSKAFFSNNSWFLFNCKNCSDCFGCTNLDGGKYYFLNKKYTKEEYKKKISGIIGSYSEIQKFSKKFSKLIDLKTIEQNFYLCENVDGAGNACGKNLINTFDSKHLEDSVNCRMSGEHSNNLSGTLASVYSTNCTEVVGTSLSNMTGFSYLLSNIKNSYYNYDIRNCEYAFLSTGLRDKKFSILNKQLSQDKYEKQLGKIIKQMDTNGTWGNFFSTDMSPHPYNDTLANDYYPVNKVIYLDKNKQYLREEIFDKNGAGTVYVLEADKFISKAYLDLGGEEKLKIKWRTRENNINTAKLKNCINSEDLPDNIKDTGEEIINKILICKKSKRPYRITRQEFKFYKKHSIPIPRFHPEVRYKKRFKKVLEFLNS